MPRTVMQEHTVMVTCPGGRMTSFPSRAEAGEWAEWGHACESVARHQIAEAVAGGYFPVQSTDPRHVCVVHP